MVILTTSSDSSSRRVFIRRKSMSVHGSPQPLPEASLPWSKGEKRGLFGICLLVFLSPFVTFFVMAMQQLYVYDRNISHNGPIVSLTVIFLIDAFLFALHPRTRRVAVWVALVMILFLFLLLLMFSTFLGYPYG
jgi:hypothetical protein